MPYRADLEALKTRHAALEREINDRRERARLLEATKAEQVALEKDLAETRALLDQLDTGRRALPMLDAVKVASPCSADWSQMIGDDRVRFCGSCQKEVYNLSSMTREDGERLLEENGADLCARFYRRTDGTILTADCPVGVAKKRVRRVAAAAAVVGGGMVAASTLVATTRPTMGALEPVAYRPTESAPSDLTEPLELEPVVAPPRPAFPQETVTMGRMTVSRPAVKPSVKPAVKPAVKLAPAVQPKVR